MQPLGDDTNDIIFGANDDVAVLWRNVEMRYANEIPRLAENILGS